MNETVDITRWNRKARRDFQKRAKLTIPGRNLPYQKALHGSPKEYYALREQEISQEKNEKLT
jgi:hypothetical protein